MPNRRRHRENHRTTRIGWLRAAVLGANDGIVSTAALLIGVASAQADARGILIAGTAALVAGAMSMAAGEYVSVSSQADTERAELEQERRELAADGPGEREELAGIYVARGLERSLAERVAEQLTAHDALGAHARDELGLSPELSARPLQAAATSALTFSLGAALPLFVALLVPGRWMTAAIGAASLACLAVLGAIAARAGGAPPLTGAVRVTFWSALAMAATAAIGASFGIAG